MFPIPQDLRAKGSGREKNGRPDLSGRPPGTGLASRRSGVLASQRAGACMRLADSGSDRPY